MKNISNIYIARIYGILYYRQQILHIETLGMMTKYQLVFIKLETSIFKIGHIVNTRETLMKADAFYSILNYIKFNELALRYKKKLVTNRLKKTISNKLFSPLQFYLKKNLANGFFKIYEYSKIFSNQKKLNDELNLIKEENSVNLIKKEQDLKTLTKKYEDLSKEINLLKTKENEYSSKIKIHDQMIYALQQESSNTDIIQHSNNLIKKNIPINEGNTKVKALEQKV